jgi:hypothetical protein
MAQGKTPHHFSAFTQIFKRRRHLEHATDFLLSVPVIWPPAGLLSAAPCSFFQPHARSSPIDPTVGALSAIFNSQFQFANKQVTPGNEIPTFITPDDGYTENISDQRLATPVIFDDVSAFAKFRRLR